MGHAHDCADHQGPVLSGGLSPLMAAIDACNRGPDARIQFTGG